MVLRMAITLGALLCAAVPSVAQDCKAIKDEKARLACFDGRAPAPRTASSPKPSASGAWSIRRHADNFSGKTSCVLSPAGNPAVQITPGHLYISYSGRGGVQGFQFRIDDGPESSMRLPTPIEQKISAVHITGADFDSVLRAKRFRVQTITLVRGIANEDLDMTPVAGLYRRMLSECPG